MKYKNIFASNVNNNVLILNDNEKQIANVQSGWRNK